MTAPSATNTPLAGIKIVDLTSVIMGPYCTQILSDMGAEVIKVESPEGDTLRAIPPARTKGSSALYRWLNRGKRSLSLNLKNPEAKALLLQLVRDADVLIHSMRPQAMAALELDYDRVKDLNPKLVYCNLFGFGSGGRYFGQPAYDDTIQAVSGMAMLQSELAGQPQYVATVMADKVCGLTAVYAVTSALLQRERNGGVGTEVEVPMFETMASFLLVEHLTGSLYDPPEGRTVYPRAISRERRPFPTADGFISVLAYNDKQWSAFADLTGRPELKVDPRFRTLQDRSRNVAQWCTTVSDALAQRTTAEWLPALEAAGIPAARVNTTQDLFNDPHLQDVDFFQTIEDPQDGPLRMPRPPVIFGKTPAPLRPAGPPLGHDTRSLLQGLGLSDQSIQELCARGIVVDPGQHTPSRAPTLAESTT